MAGHFITPSPQPREAQHRDHHGRVLHEGQVAGIGAAADELQVVAAQEFDGESSDSVGADGRHGEASGVCSPPIGGAPVPRNAADGWTFDATGTTLDLTGSTFERVRNGEVAMLAVLFACGPVPAGWLP